MPSLRNMLAQPSSTITFRRLMDEGAIVICNLAKGSLGESTAHLLGALITTAFAQAALSRADTAVGDRRVFHLYADEFQSFATESFALILSEARKYALTLTIGHQYLDQLPDQLPSAVSATPDPSSPAALVPKTPRSFPSRSDWVVPMRCSIFLISPYGRACCDAACPHPPSALTSVMRRGRGDLTRTA